MISFWPTLIAAIILMGLVVSALAIGWLLTGKNHLYKRCGWTPKSNHPDQKCSLCGRTSACETDESEKK